MANRSPSQLRMHGHALAVLEVAEASAHDGPIEPQPAIRLALSWLVISKVAKLANAIEFWNLLTQSTTDPDRWIDHYTRRRDLRIYLRSWKREAGFGE